MAIKIEIADVERSRITTDRHDGLARRCPDAVFACLADSLDADDGLHRPAYAGRNSGAPGGFSRPWIV